jgi:hypothetical protein
MKSPLSIISSNIFDNMKNGGGRDLDLVLRSNVDRYEAADVASDGSMVSRWCIGFHGRL